MRDEDLAEALRDALFTDFLAPLDFAFARTVLRLLALRADDFFAAPFLPAEDFRADLRPEAFARLDFFAVLWLRALVRPILRASLLEPLPAARCAAPAALPTAFFAAATFAGLAAALPAIAPSKPPTTAPTGPATLPTTAPAAAPAVVLEIGGTSSLSEEELDCSSAIK